MVQAKYTINDSFNEQPIEIKHDAEIDEFKHIKIYTLDEAIEETSK